MKKAFLTVILTLAAGSVLAGTGTVNFNNSTGSGSSLVFAPISDTDGTLAKSDVFAQLYYSDPGGTLAKVGAVVSLKADNTGTFAGGTRTLTLAAGNGVPAKLQVRAWKGLAGSSWETATIRGESNILENAPTGDPTGDPPGTPRNMVGLQAFSLVPEPASLTLGALAAASLLFRRRRQTA